MSETTERLDAIRYRAGILLRCLEEAPNDSYGIDDLPTAIHEQRNDVPYLLTLARKQAAALERVEAMHVMEFIEDGEYSRNRCADCRYEAEGREDCPTVETIRAALEATK